MEDLGRSAPDIDDVVLQLITPRLGRNAPSMLEWEHRELLETSAGEVAVWHSGSGPAVLLVHGWSSTHTDMDAFVAPLLERGYRVVALDLPAHGASAGATATMTEISAAIGEVGSRFGPLAGLVAHSFGCPSSATALANGKLSAARVVLVASPAYYEILVRATAESADIDPLELIAAFAARGVDVAALNLPETVAKLALPALIFHSADDRIVDIRFGEAVAAAWRDSTFVPLTGLGHSRILRDPGVVRRAAEFIAGGT
jgi:pimeloyl-ACP methyl ester carboxylesterase